MKKSKFLLLGIVLVSIFAVSCKKDDNDKPKTDSVLAAQENALAQNLFDDIFKQADNASRKMDDSLTGSKSVYNTTANCAHITITPFDLDSFPKTVTVDFGMTNCLGNDLRYRRGKLIYTISSWYRDSGCVITLNPNNFYINDHKVEGTKIYTNKGRDNDGYLIYDVRVNNAVITKPDGNSFSWSSIRQHRWIAGENTLLDPMDDVYLLTGNAEGEASDGGAFSMVIGTPLNVAVNCRWIRTGTVTLTTEEYPSILVNYGALGFCDAEATVSVNGANYSFTMN